MGWMVLVVLTMLERSFQSQLSLVAALHRSRLPILASYTNHSVFRRRIDILVTRRSIEYENFAQI